jgi:drug/metabolite transporter (DMT)-like permease
VLVVATLGLFAVWSNSFIAMSYLLGSDAAPQRLDWVALTVARMLPAGLICAGYCLLFRRSESSKLLRHHWRRLLLCAACVVPGYNFALYYGQQQAVPAPIASLITTLVPLFVMILAVSFLGERVSSGRLAGFAVAVAGTAVIALARMEEIGGAYPAIVAVVVLAPLSWSCYSVLSKPLAGRCSPVVWTYLATAIGAAFLLPLLPQSARGQWAALDLRGWGALLYLSLPCTVLGFAVWTWLLRHLPASVVGFTVFLNPPLTALSKWILASLFPETFLFTIRTQEWVGGTITLAGLALALGGSRRIALYFGRAWKR